MEVKLEVCQLCTRFPVGSRFIRPSKICSTKPLSKAVSNVFKLIYSQIENFHRKSKLLSIYNKFRILENVDPLIENVKIIIEKRKLNLLHHMTLVLCTQHFLMIN